MSAPEHPVPHDAADRSERSATVVTSETPLGGAIYPFLAATGKEWSVLAHPIGEAIRYPQRETFTMRKPTLRWVNGSTLMDVFVDGLTTEQFLATTGLSLSLEKGGYVLSKRLSRLMRPHFVSSFFPAEELRVTYQDDLDPNARKVWDGAGVISRRFLEHLTIAPGVSAAKRDSLRRQLASCRRVEFTLMTDRGQDKGHAIVADDLDADFVLPHDTKPEVKLLHETCFVGIDVVHAHESMRLDIQSLINVHPFFGEEQLAQWLEDEGRLFISAVQSGSVGEAMQRLERHSDLTEVTQWPLREYLASGGQPLWFADVTRHLLNQHLSRLNSSTLEKLHLPIPGGRFYVMPMGVGQVAGVEQDVPRGHVRLDRAYATAWVNDDDWMQLEGAQTGIAGLLGGADNDDALWVHGFTDYDDYLKVLCWRSPNQVGEYVLLEPTLGSFNLDWHTPEGTIQYPPGDSRLLPPRKDTATITYQHVIDPATAGGLGEGKPYSIGAMVATIERAIDNTGTLGMYCNVLMLHKAIAGRLPDHLPAELEAVIDGSVKTGVDLSLVRQWCFAESTWLLDHHIPVPAILASRVLGAAALPVTLTEDHWLDGLVGEVRDHIAAFTRERDDLVQTAMPPAVVFDHAFNESDADYIAIGAGLHHVYTNTLRLLARQKGTLAPEDYDMARQEAEAYLERFRPEQHTEIVRGAIVSAYLSEKPSDTVLWLAGAKTPQGRASGMAHLTMRALREIGVLQELGQTSAGIQVYPGAVTSAPTYQHSIGMTGVWFNWYRAWQEAQGQTPAATTTEVPKSAAAWAKQQVADLARTAYHGLTVTIATHGERKVATTEGGHLFGFISRDSTHLVPNGAITLVFSLCHDGNLRCLWQSTQEKP